MSIAQKDARQTNRTLGRAKMLKFLLSELPMI